MNRVGRALKGRGAAVLLAGALWLVLGSVVGAQRTPTDPSRTWIYCWGYHVGAGRQYSCVSSVARQPIMESFLPAEGTQCAGRIRGYSGGRTGIQLDCGDVGSPAGWTRSGTGPDYFTKPASAVRVRITSSYSGSSENFVVWCEGPGGSRALIVNEIVGTLFDNNGTDGVYRMRTRSEPCTKVEVQHSVGVRWSFRQLDAATAYSPPRYWSHVTGAGSGWDAEALQHLAIAVEEERAAVAVQPPVR